MWTFALFWYNIYDNYDCSYVFDYTYILLYNLAFTSLPVIFLGVLDQDVSDKVSLAVPQLYRRGIERKEWTQTKFWIYMVDGLYQSIICFFMPYLLFSPGTFNTESGHNVNDYTRVGVYISNATIVVVNVYVLLNTYRWDWLMLLLTGISILLIWAWTGIYTEFTASFMFYKAATQVYGTLGFWAQTLLTVIICLIPRFCAKAFQKIFMPRDVDIIREQVRQGKFDYLDDVDPELLSGAQTKMEKQKSLTSSSDDSDRKVRPSDERPMYPPSVAATATTNGARNPHSTQGSDDSTLPSGLKFDVERMNIPTIDTGLHDALDPPNRSSLDRPRPSFDRMRSSFDKTRTSFEASNDFTSAAMLRRIESGGRSPGRSPITPETPTGTLGFEAARSRSRLRESSVYDD